MPYNDGTVLVLITGLSIDTAPRSGFTKKGLLRRLQEVRTGDFSKVYLPIDTVNQQSLGIAVVKYACEEDARRSIEALNGTKLDNESVLKMERFEGSGEWGRLVERGIVDKSEVGGLTVLQIVGGNL